MSRSACPFCRQPLSTPQSPCRSCGRGAPSRGAAGNGGGDDDLGDGELDLTRGGSMESPSGGSSTYAGGGLAFADDDPFAEEVPPGALELDWPPAHASPGFASDPSLRAAHPAAPSSGDLPPAPVPEEPALPPPPDPAAIIARFPPPTAKVWEAPGYAMKVLWRQFELRQDLIALRNRRSPDVPLYERALRAYDAKTYTLGLAITCVALVLASVLFFLPVIVRFLRAPS